MDHTSTLLSVAALWTLAVLTPGPNFLVTVRLAGGRSRAAGLQGVAGIGVGTLAWAGAGCLGVQALFTAAPWAYAALKLGGGAYLLLTGARLLLARGGDGAGADALPDGARAAGAGPFWAGLATNLANPKSALFMAGIFAAAMPPQPPPGLALGAMAVMAGISVCWYGLVACLLSTRALLGAYRRGRRWVDRVAGACFVLFGARLLISR